MLEAIKIGKSFPGTGPVLQNINLSFLPGEIHAIVGESGSGKTTLLNILAGLAEATNGEVLFNRKILLPPSQQLIAGHPKIKLVSQDFKLFPNLSLRENILYPIRFLDKEYKNFRADQLISLLKLDKISSHFPAGVSGGEKQRTAIAQAIADEPSVLLLDEPFSQLDSGNKDLLKKEIISLVEKEKIACAFVTHDANDSLSVADKISIIGKGKIIQTGTPLEIYFKPVNKYVAGLGGIYNLIPEKMFNNFVEQKNKKLMLRPNQIKINANGKYAGRVKEIYFLGDRYQAIIASGEFKILKTFSTQILPINAEIKFDIDFENPHWIL